MENETVWLKHPQLGIQEHPAWREAELIEQGYEVPTQDELDDFNTVVEPQSGYVKMRHPDWETPEDAYTLVEEQFVEAHEEIGFERVE